MRGLNAGGDFRRRRQAGERVIDREAVFRNRFGFNRDADLFATLQRTEVFGGALRDGDDQVGTAKEVLHVDPGCRERCFIGLVAEGEVVGEIDNARRVGVGHANGALIGVRHGN